MQNYYTKKKICNTSIHVHNFITRTQVAGKCFETITKLTTTLPANVSELTNFTCGSFNRKGQLCGECKRGYGPTLFKYHRQCANCSTINYGWALYLLIEFLPITVLCDHCDFSSQCNFRPFECVHILGTTHRRHHE